MLLEQGQELPGVGNRWISEVLEAIGWKSPPRGPLRGAQ